MRVRGEVLIKDGLGVALGVRVRVGVWMLLWIMCFKMSTLTFIFLRILVRVGGMDLASTFSSPRFVLI